jgi:6-phosphogluconolactonase (cycloisomerase 2 family)
MGKDSQGIHVFAVEGGRWRKVQTVASERPVSLALHPDQRFLYAANEIDTYQHLPSGSVEAFAIDPASGHLTHLNRQSLSLSATSPRHLAVSPDGKAVVVAVHGGGAYNMLPLSESGELGRVSAILKEAGSSVHEEHQTAAHPQMVLFDSTGQRLLGADMGSDRLSVLSLERHQMTVNHRSSSRAGSGPSSMALHPDGHLLFVANGLETSISSYRYDAHKGKIGDQLEHVFTARSRTKKTSSAVMAMHPSGRFLYTASRDAEGVTVWRIDAFTGNLTPVQFADQGLHGARTMMMAANGESLVLAAREQNSVIRLQLDPSSGRIKGLASVAEVSAPVSIAMKYA